ncbi:RluA family pseudouridine synthase [Enhydrobacter sp.]|jgi:23S rRNA pseudouridine1911/1915/1917 synthase|uniref:RluA family pseudouridine synthase n=1 Tax=Enhydrobacter sp. TaxID=1894999 RepID=UPI0026056567|nr:RluA family pseudouridine synthase [Enhydrobacter sp.]WIM13490.1 MAG: LSU rRNA pseudouridine(1911/1915/1917) synthase [Enhydrobacter sp.]
MSEAGRHIVTVDERTAGERLDRALTSALPALTRSRVKALIEGRRVALAGGATIEEPSRKVKTGERFVVDIPEPEPAQPQPQARELDILHEDADLLVLNKPAGLVVHPAPGNPDNTLVNALLAHCGDSLSGIGGVRRPGIVHRLDKDTSGVMVVAKNDTTHRALSRLFAVHDLTRIYQAIVWGAPSAKRATIEAAIGRHPIDRKRMAVRRSGGKQAATDYWVERRFGPPLEPWASQVSARLHTGRTHQVRVHLAHIGCPIVGDPTYGRTRGRSRNSDIPLSLKSFGRQALHAAVLEFRHPGTGREMRFATEMPQDMKMLVAELNDVKLSS